MNGLTIDVFQSGRLGEELQDAFFTIPAADKYARETSLLRLFLSVAQIENMKLISAPQRKIGAVSCLAYIPTAGNRHAQGSIITGNTGDAHAILFAVNGTNVVATLLTKNNSKSHNFFSGQNTDYELIPRQKDIHPTIQKHSLDKFRTSSDTKLYLGVMTDGAIPDIDTALNDQQIKSVENYAAETAARCLQISAFRQDQSLPALSKCFGETARRLLQRDCITAVFVDITTPPEQGVMIGVFDGYHVPGAREFTRGLAETIREEILPPRL